MNGRAWTPEELAILDAHHGDAHAAVAALTAAGHTRSLSSVRTRLAITHRAAAGFAGCPAPTPLEALPGLSSHTARRLHQLAESNPSPAEYERRKRQILREANQS